MKKKFTPLKSKSVFVNLQKHLFYAAIFAGTMFVSAIAKAQITGPSTDSSPYVIPVSPGVQTTSILTANDSINGYPMVGVPDGLGAFDNGDGTFTLLSP